MPHVEILPNSTTSTSAPGWAYVPDTGYDPSKAPIVPSGARKRARNAPLGSAASGGAGITGEALSARQLSKITKHLAELDKDSHRDVQIVVQGKPRDVGQRGPSKSGKMTAGVRRILTSQKTWANYLADEEAMLAAGGAQPQQHHHQAQGTERRASVDLPRRGSGKQARLAAGKRKASSADKRGVDAEPMDIDSPSGTRLYGTRTAQTAHQPVVETPSAAPVASSDDGDTDPFLKSRIPPLPTQEEIDALLAAPPLTYSAARAAPTTSTAPPRQFCEMCGYWGRVRCMKCGVRVCGLECKTQHDETRCLKFYA